MWKSTTLIITIACFCFIQTHNVQSDDLVKLDIAYKQGDISSYENERCKLDVYLPANQESFATMVWFHGGGLQNGDKAISEMAPRFTKEGIAVVSVNYRLSPKGTFPDYIDDAAASVAWTLKHIAEYGGDPAKVFVSGHSAGGYLAAMVGVDPRYLQKAGVSPNQVAGYLPVSGQMITHSTVREERGIGTNTPIIDLAAPLFYVGNKAKPFLNIAGDSDLAGRAEENLLFVAFMKDAGNEETQCVVFKERDHVTLVTRMNESGDPVSTTMIEFIKRLSQ
jgi:acetyl esterase/lipase